MRTIQNRPDKQFRILILYSATMGNIENNSNNQDRTKIFHNGNKLIFKITVFMDNIILGIKIFKKKI